MQKNADTIRVGFIGCGNHSGSKIYPALRGAGLDLVAVCDADQAKAEQRAAEYGVNRVYTDFGKMCDAEKMDAVLVVIGPQAHYECAMALVARGYHVWTEKPCSATTAQADELVRAAEKAGRIIQVGFNYRYTLGIQKAMDLMQNGRFGQPGMVTVHWWLGTPDLTSLWHHYMVHAVDLLRYAAGRDLTLDHAASSTREGRRYFLATFRTTDGDLAVLDMSCGMPVQGHWARVDWHSADGLLSVEDFTRVTHYAAHGEQKNSPYDGDHVWPTESLWTKNLFVQTWGYITELTRFREAVQGRRTPEATVQDAAWGMHVCEQLVQLAQTRQP